MRCAKPRVEPLEGRNLCDVAPLPYAMPLLAGPGTPSQPPQQYVAPATYEVVVPFVQTPVNLLQVPMVVGSEPAPPGGIPQLHLDLPYPMSYAEP